MKQYIDLLNHVYSTDIKNVEKSIYYIDNWSINFQFIGDTIYTPNVVCLDYSPYCSISYFFKENLYDYEALILDKHASINSDVFLEESLLNFLKVAKKNLKFLLQSFYKYLTIDIRILIRSFLPKIVHQNTEEESFTIFNMDFFINKILYYLKIENGKRKTFQNNIGAKTKCNNIENGKNGKNIVLSAINGIFVKNASQRLIKRNVHISPNLSVFPLF